jgi:DNA-binding CsgD family transcriptional regulator/tetratricopeptide (TPR) repeat protein
MTVQPATAGFVGRERELSALSLRLDAARAGAGGIVLVAGEPGIGKTRTAEEFARLAGARGAVVRWGRCHEGEGAPALWPWMQILRSCLRDRDAETLPDELGARVVTLAQLLPEMDGGSGHPASPAPLEADQARFQLFDAVTAFLCSGARRQPLCLILDDLHWADRPSLLLLQFLARAMDDARLLVVGTYRDVEVNRRHPLAATLADLARIQGTERITLRGLPEREVADLIERVLGRPPAPALVQAVAQGSEGNLFFITEIARLLAVEGEHSAWNQHDGALARLTIPHSVREVIGRRLDQLSTACNEALRVAAVIGREFPLVALERILVRSDRATLDGSPAVFEAVEEAEAAGVIVPAPGTPGRLRFSHVLIRDTLYEELPPTRRARLHRQVGEVLERVYAASIPGHLAELAHHFVLGAPIGDAAKGLSYARRAADHTLALFAYDNAAELYRRALDCLYLLQMEDPDAADAAGAAKYDGVECQLLIDLGDARRAAGEMEEARRTFTEAASLARRLNSAEHLARAALGFGLDLYQRGHVDAAQLDLLEEAVAAYPAEDSETRAMLMARLAVARYSATGNVADIGLSREALAMARRRGTPRVVAYTLNFTAVTSGDRPVADRLAITNELQALASATSNSVLDLTGRAWRIMCLWEMGQGAVATTELERYMHQADQIRQPRYQFQAIVFRATQAMTAGRFDEAEALTQGALALGERAGRADAKPVFALQTFLLRMLWDRTENLLPEISDIVQRNPDSVAWRSVLAYLQGEAGQPAQARSSVERVLVHGLSNLPPDTYWLTVLVMLGEACASMGDAELAGALLTTLMPFAGQCSVVGGGYGCLGAVARTLGRLATLLGQREEAARHFEVAISVNRQLESPPWLARTQTDFAAALIGWARADQHSSHGPVHAGATARIRTLLDDAIATAREFGLRGVGERAVALKDEVAALEAGVKLPASPLLDGLSAREVEVLGLIADGRTSREIADTLGISPATVERHITNLYRKISARGRADATAYAMRHGIDHSTTA